MAKADSVDVFLGDLSEDDRLIFDKVKHAVELVYPNPVAKLAWQGIGFKQDANYVCNVYRAKTGMNIMVMRGAMLNDKYSLLSGEGQSTRNYKVAKPSDFKLMQFKDLLMQQSKLYSSGIKWEG